MAADRIIEIEVEGLRTLADVKLELDGLTVLIGDNSTGKSSLIEACQILSSMARPDFYTTLHQVHGGLNSLLRLGAPRLRLAVRIGARQTPAGSTTDALPKDLCYELIIARDGQHTVFSSESLREVASNQATQVILARNGLDSSYYRSVPERPETSKPLQASRLEHKGSVRRDELLLASFGTQYPDPAIARMIKTLGTVETHVPVDVLPYWVGRKLNWESPLRSSVDLAPADALSLKGANLANTFYALKNERSPAEWQDILEDIRLGLGDDIEDIQLRVDPGGGAIALWLKYRCFDKPISARGLSDGTLAWLAFVAMSRLSAEGGLLAFDEPEAHIHPNLLMRVLSLFESISSRRPVLLATHSDRLLDGLLDPAASVVLCQLDEKRATRLIRPDRATLDRWLEDYRGVGDIRAAGHQASILPPAEEG